MELLGQVAEENLVMVVAVERIGINEVKCAGLVKCDGIHATRICLPRCCAACVLCSSFCHSHIVCAGHVVEGCKKSMYPESVKSSN